MGWESRLHEFVCHRCGQCCRGEGYVWLTQEDMEGLAAHLGMEFEAFVRKHTRLAEGRLALVDRAEPSRPCIFYEEGLGCRVHEAKPQQCRDFPVRWRDESAITFCRGLQALDAE